MKRQNKNTTITAAWLRITDQRVPAYFVITSAQGLDFLVSPHKDEKPVGPKKGHCKLKPNVKKIRRYADYKNYKVNGVCKSTSRNVGSSYKADEKSSHE